MPQPHVGAVGTSDRYMQGEGAQSAKVTRRSGGLPPQGAQRLAVGVTGIAAAGRTRRTGCGARAGRGCKLAERWPRAAGLHKAAGARVRRARSRAERRAGLAGTLPLFCTQRWASANCRTQRADMGRRALESWRPLERRLSMATLVDIIAQIIAARNYVSYYQNHIWIIASYYETLCIIAQLL